MAKFVSDMVNNMTSFIIRIAHVKAISVDYVIEHNTIDLLLSKTLEFFPK